MQHHASTETGTYPQDATGLPAVRDTETVRLEDGDELDLTIAPVAKRIGEGDVRMLAYNGSIPGPSLRVRQGTEIVVHVTNDADVEATVHWHGLRLENRYDGVPHDTQRPIPVGGSFTYRVRFPDEGLYWYHPHIREDYTQDSGLYGTIVVEPSDPDTWAPADREVVLTVDDVLVEDGRLAAYDRAGPDHTAMGRFGNVFLVSGGEDWSMAVARGEVVRYFLVNTANTRIFNVAIPGARMKLVGGDSGRTERETFVEEVLIAPSERAVLDVLFDRPGELTLEHRTPDRTVDIGRILVSDGGAPTAAAEAFETLRRSPELEAERARLEADIARAPDETLALVAEMDMAPPSAGGGPEGAPRFACPMDPQVVSDDQGNCPICGMKLLPIEYVPAALELLEGQGHADHDAGNDAAQDAHGGHAEGSSEWEDTMEEINRATDPSNMRWILLDRETGKRNAEIDWTFAVGDRVKIRLENEMDSDHPMHHPFHIHGAGRFLVLTRGGTVEPNLVWKDTVLVRTGETVDILLDVSNPGLWMAHCHIAEHAESGMMFSFQVTRTRR
jgi:FtsP/CotA-like multicopper oxidase with cupredoxin domain